MKKMIMACVLASVLFPIWSMGQWKPFVEVGKEWHYSWRQVVYDEEYNPTLYQWDYVLKIVGDTVVNGQEYAEVRSYCFNAFGDGTVSDEYNDKLYCLLREPENGLVYVGFPAHPMLPPIHIVTFSLGFWGEVDSEAMLFSMDSPAETVWFYQEFDNPDLKEWYGTLEEYTITGNDGDTLSGWIFGNSMGNGKCKLIEGLGFLTEDEEPSSILGPLAGVPALPSIEGDTYLFSVIDGSGKEIYHYAPYEPQLLSTPQINVDADEESTLYTISGMKMDRNSARPGIYIRQQNGKTSKVVIK